MSLTVQQVNQMVVDGTVTAEVGAAMIQGIMQSPADVPAKRSAQPIKAWSFADSTIKPSDVIMDSEVLDHADKGLMFRNQEDTASLGASVHIAGLLFHSKVLLLADHDATKLALQQILTKAIPVDDKEPAYKTGKPTNPITKSTGLLKVAGLEKTASYWTRLTRYTKALHELKGLGGVEAMQACFVQSEFEDKPVTTLISADEVEAKVKALKKDGKTPETMEEAFVRLTRTTKNMAETHIKNKTTAGQYEKKLETFIAGLKKAMKAEAEKYTTKKVKKAA